MKKAREFWIYADRGGYWATTIMPRPVSRAIHVREVLDPDPKDKVIKKLKTAIRTHHDTWAQVNNDELCLAECRRVCAALAAVEKLEKGECL